MWKLKGKKQFQYFIQEFTFLLIIFVFVLTDVYFCIIRVMVCKKMYAVFHSTCKHIFFHSYFNSYTVFHLMEIA